MSLEGNSVKKKSGKVMKKFCERDAGGVVVVVCGVWGSAILRSRIG